MRVAATFAARVSASHALTLYLAWIAFTRGSVSLGGMVLAAKAATGLAVPLLIGRLHDRGSLSPLLRAAAAFEAVAAIVLVMLRSSESGGGVAAVALAVLLGATSSLFDTAVYPLLLAARPGRLQPHVLAGLSYDVAKVAGSSVVLVLLAATGSPVPVILVSLLSLAGWALAAQPASTAPKADALVASAPSPDTEAVSPRSGGRYRPPAPVVALMMVGLLPGQLVAYQTMLADGSFREFAVLGTLFAVGAVAGNLTLQRVPVSATSTAVAYLATGIGLAVALLSPHVSMAVFGAGTAAHYQLTRALVVASAPPSGHGRASGRLTASSKVAGAAGALVAASMLDQPSIMVWSGVALSLAAAGVVAAARR